MLCSLYIDTHLLTLLRRLTTGYECCFGECFSGRQRPIRVRIMVWRVYPAVQIPSDNVVELVKSYVFFIDSFWFSHADVRDAKSISQTSRKALRNSHQLMIFTPVLASQRILSSGNRLSACFFPGDKGYYCFV